MPASWNLYLLNLMEQVWWVLSSKFRLGENIYGTSSFGLGTLFWIKRIFFECLFIFERKTEYQQGRSQERGEQRIWNRLQALSCQHRAWCGASTHEPRDHALSIAVGMLNWLSHPGAPRLRDSLVKFGRVLFGHWSISSLRWSLFSSVSLVSLMRTWSKGCCSRTCWKPKLQNWWAPVEHLKGVRVLAASRRLPC